MDHADVLDRLATAFSGPGKLASIDADQSPDGDELRRHLDGCDACRGELDAWRLTSLALAAATPESLHAPLGARERVLAAVAATGVARGGARSAAGPRATSPRLASLPPTLTALPGGSGDPDRADHGGPARLADGARVTVPGSDASGRFPFRRVALAAAIAVLVFVGGAVLGPRLGLTQEPSSGGRDLTPVVTFIGAIAQQPGHLTAALYTPDGKPGGSVLVNPATGDLAVVSTALPASSEAYDCFVGRGASLTRVGLMQFSGQTSYWIGKVASVSDPGEPGDWFEVRLGGVAGALTLHGSF